MNENGKKKKIEKYSTTEWWNLKGEEIERVGCELDKTSNRLCMRNNNILF